MFKLEMKTGGSAFRDSYTGEENDVDEAREVARILREVADKLEYGYRDGGCIDINGNNIGKFTF